MQVAVDSIDCGAPAAPLFPCRDVQCYQIASRNEISVAESPKMSSTSERTLCDYAAARQMIYMG